MRSKLTQRISAVAVIALFVGSSLYASPSAPSSNKSETSIGNWYYVDRSSALLRDLQEVAAKLNRDAETLNSFQRPSQMSWESHAHYLNLVRGLINEAGTMLRELQGMRHASAPWQQDAIDRVTPVAVDVAKHTETAIKHLNENRRSILFTEYQNRVQMLTDSSVEMKTRIDNILDYADTRQELQRLQTRLGVENL
jgi:hypothetical protein